MDAQQGGGALGPDAEHVSDSDSIDEALEEALEATDSDEHELGGEMEEDEFEVPGWGLLMGRMGCVAG